LIRNNKTLKFAAPAGFVKHARDADLVTAAVREMDEELYGLFDTNLLDQLIRHAYSKRHYVF
jgi:ADP-ribose pyrophosphatase YjhB (NUDIX family)